jgi:hypothetical protein
MYINHYFIVHSHLAFGLLVVASSLTIILSNKQQVDSCFKTQYTASRACAWPIAIKTMALCYPTSFAGVRRLVIFPCVRHSDKQSDVFIVITSKSTDQIKINGQISVSKNGTPCSCSVLRSCQQ